MDHPDSKDSCSFSVFSQFHIEPSEIQIDIKGNRYLLFKGYDKVWYKGLNGDNTRPIFEKNMATLIKFDKLGSIVWNLPFSIEPKSFQIDSIGNIALVINRNNPSDLFKVYSTDSSF